MHDMNKFCFFMGPDCCSLLAGKKCPAKSGRKEDDVYWCYELDEGLKEYGWDSSWSEYYRSYLARSQGVLKNSSTALYVVIFDSFSQDKKRHREFFNTPQIVVHAKKNESVEG